MTLKMDGKIVDELVMAADTGLSPWLVNDAARCIFLHAEFMPEQGGWSYTRCMQAVDVMERRPKGTTAAMLRNDLVARGIRKGPACYLLWLDGEIDRRLQDENRVPAEPRG